MSDEPKKRSRAWIWWTASVLFLVAYPLSIGPAFRIFERTDNEWIRSAYKTVYAPLFWVCSKWETLSSTKTWYILSAVPDD
jgi:hypothetical protein